jgi:hypothetical protein
MITPARWRFNLQRGRATRVVPEPSSGHRCNDVRPGIAQQLAHWLKDTDFNGVRGHDALAKLPEAERQPWRTLWADVAATLARAQEKGTPAEKKASPAETPKKG